MGLGYRLGMRVSKSSAGNYNVLVKVKNHQATEWFGSGVTG